VAKIRCRKRKSRETRVSKNNSLNKKVYVGKGGVTQKGWGVTAYFIALYDTFWRGSKAIT